MRIALGTKVIQAGNHSNAFLIPNLRLVIPQSPHEPDFEALLLWRTSVGRGPGHLS